MKNIKILLLVISLGFTNSFYAADSETNSKALSAEISKLMKKHYLSLEDDIVVDVEFKVNGYREIVVLSVNCDNPEVREYVAQCLNNRKPNVNFFKEGKLYTVPLRLKS